MTMPCGNYLGILLPLGLWSLFYAKEALSRDLNAKKNLRGIDVLAKIQFCLVIYNFYFFRGKSVPLFELKIGPLSYGIG
jgi:hypothetical protein